MPIKEEHKITRQGKVVVLYGGLLSEAHDKNLAGIETGIVQVPDEANGNVAICWARVHMKGQDGETQTYSGIGDASPANVSRNIVPHLLRMSECLTLDAEILTRQGWRSHSEVSVGDEVLAYDVEADVSRWVELEAINVYDPVPVVCWQGRSFKFTGTPNHKWVIQKQGKRVKAAQRELKPADKMTTADSIIISALAEGGDHPLSERDAAILGWLATDGSLRWHYVTDKYGTWGPYPKAHIDQSKPHYVEEIRELLGEDAGERQHQAPDRQMPSGQVSTFLRSSRFTLRAAYLRRLLETTGLEEWSGLPALVCKLSSPARIAMLDAMLKGDGTQNASGRWCFGKKRKPGVMEAWELLATLEGHALGSPQASSVGDVPVRVLRTNRLANNNYLTRSEEGVAPVWCPTTSLGTWYVRQSGYISITGNTRAKARALRDSVNVGDLDLDGDPTSEESQERSQEAVGASAQSGRGNPPQNSGAARGGANSVSSGQAATDSQIKFLTRLAGEYSSVEKLEESVGCKLSDLSKRDAQRYIGELRSRLGYADEESG